MARASVKLIEGSSYSGRGYRFGKVETKIISNDADIAYFRGNSRFRVKDMPDTKPAPPKKGKADAKAKAESAPAGDTGGETGEDDGLLPWRKDMKKAQLIEAAESRDIAVTPDDTVATIVQMLTEWDEEHGGEGD